MSNIENKEQFLQSLKRLEIELESLKQRMMFIRNEMKKK